MGASAQGREPGTVAAVLDRSSLLSAVPGLVHGFSDRNDGVSKGPHATLNLGRRWNDDPAAVEDNHRRLAEAGGYAVDQLRTVRQVHEATVMPASVLEPDSTADGLWCRSGEGIVTGVLTADCVPILIADRRGTVAAAVHSGWRGTVADIAGQAVARLVEAGVTPADLVAAIGPCIEQAAFEVGEEVAAQFDPLFDGAFVERERWPKPHVDLVGVVRAQLSEAGVADDAIERVGACTHDHPDRWFSYRRDGAGIGQMLSFAGYPAV